MKYIHDVWFTDTGERFSEQPIVTKKEFKKKVTEYYRNDGKMTISFCLLESPNTTVYQVYPYINRCGNLALMYVENTSEKNTDEIDLTEI